MYQTKRMKSYKTNNYTNEMSKTSYLEDLMSSEYHKLNYLFSDIKLLAESAINDTTNMVVLDNLIRDEITALMEVATWLSEERCSEWTDTLDRYGKTVHAFVATYVSETHKK